ncbi:MAG TPA: hypothetical protein VFY86_02330 [Nocardioides sp.]|nr:hypothetical protein [Nocardioides sp.]
MRLPLPGPRDVWAALERGAESLELLLALMPRVTGLVGEAEKLLQRVDALVERIETTRSSADGVVSRADSVVTRSEDLVDYFVPFNQRLTTLLDALEPPLTRLQPTLERLAETTDPHEVDAAVELIDHLPKLAQKMEVDIIPVLDSLSSVAPDLHDLLDVSRELNEMLGQIPGVSRVKKRIDAEQDREAEEQS